MIKKPLISIIICMSLFLLFQNCGSNEFSVESSHLVEAGNETGGGLSLIIDKPIKCVKGKKLGVWLDPNNSGQVLSKNYLGDITTFSGSKSAADNYNYYSESAHPIKGPRAKSYELNVFFYTSDSGKKLNLNIFSNIDGGGSPKNKVNIDIHTQGNNLKDKVLLSDDGKEFKMTSSHPQLGKFYSGRFTYWKNTDGGVIGPFLGNAFKIQVKVLGTGDVKEALFHSATGKSFKLKNASKHISSFIIMYKDYEKCE